MSKRRGYAELENRMQEVLVCYKEFRRDFDGTSYRYENHVVYLESLCRLNKLISDEAMKVLKKLGGIRR
ncbi:hypothetical protein [Fibrobacter sp. UWH3]|uniref:hypothetical protein n=1 Tax=Fibrobacter sp. UWH3 TaxID=1964353 RepID=UPI000915716C|nr:hypothetical protein [Fibrobacter sp. UWH3]OWV05328.1 hypothetical protein B7993_08625 [Fibrobacter sp. UWH3]SHL28415.1 hypothetical protein SAMN05720765_11267 [Fibrobacter sp. UWH6]